MAKVSYYLAVSLDGFLAREDGSVDWLNNYMEPLDTPYDYDPYYQSVGGVVMGRKTFEKVLSFGEYAYKGKPGLVLSRNPDFSVDLPEVETVSATWREQVNTLSKSIDGRLWLVGGGEIASLFLKENLLDEIVLTIIPETIGTGIGWLGSSALSAGWTLSEHYIAKKSGVVQLIYSKK